MHTTFKNLSLNTHIFEELDSTSSFLKREYKNLPKLSFCITRSQLNGYGRLGSDWVSDSDDLTFSVLLPFIEPANHLTGLSQLVVMVIHRCLLEMSDSIIKLKWPNDLYLDGNKLAGIVIEVLHSTENISWLVIGVGINLSDHHKKFEDYSSARIRINEPYRLVRNIVEALKALSESFDRNYWVENKSYWQSHDFFNLRDAVKVIHNGKVIDAFYSGVADNADLVVFMDENMDSEKSQLNFSSATVSLRAKK